MDFAPEITRFVVRRYQADSEKLVIANLVGRKPEELAEPKNYLTWLTEWLKSSAEASPNSLAAFLENQTN